MGHEWDTNEEQNRLKDFEKKRHDKDKDPKHDPDGHLNSDPTGDIHRDEDMLNDGGAVGRNNAADKSGR